MEAARQRFGSWASWVSRRSRIFIATWRSGRNFGDDYIAGAMEAHVLTRTSSARVVHANLFLDSYRTNPDDLVIVGGGGIWGPLGDGRLDPGLYAAWMKVRCPLVLANIGFESFTPAGEGELRSLAPRVALFSVRDQESWQIVSGVLGADRVLWSADTSYLHPTQLDRRVVSRRVGVNLCNPAQERLLPMESATTIARGVAQLRQSGYDLRAVSLRSGGPNPDFAFCRQVDPDCPEAFVPDVFRECELFIGMRYHSILLALQNLIPVVAIVCSLKVRRLMEEYGLAEYAVDPARTGFERNLASAVAALDPQHVVEKMRKGNVEAERRVSAFAARLDPLLNPDEAVRP